MSVYKPFRAFQAGCAKNKLSRFFFATAQAILDKKRDTKVAERRPEEDSEEEVVTILAAGEDFD